MRRFEKRINDRKQLVTRLSQLTGLNARYTFVPRCAYEIDAFTVEKDGGLTVGDGADESILEMLISENMIGKELPVEQPLRRTQVDRTSVRGTVSEDSMTFGTEEWEGNGWDTDSESEEETSEEQEIWRPDTDIFSEIDTAHVTEKGWPSDGRNEFSTVPDNKSDQKTMEESAANLGIREEGLGVPLTTSICFPVSNHTPTSIINLVCMLYSRGQLLSKATNGMFYAGKELVDDLLDHPTFPKTKDVVSYLQQEGAHEQIKGLSFDSDKIILDGFGMAKDLDHFQSFMKLAAAMNKMALTQKRIQAKKVDDTNEKYALRIWLIRLGMVGNDYKADRKHLMENLSGHTAFRNEAVKGRWTARQAAKRNTSKAEKP